MRFEIRKLGLYLEQLDGHYVRLGLAVLTLVLFVLGASAPSIGGGH